ncbi:hypothetical protein, partial [Paenibacillus tianmuensis]|uniref:hypothetical protein n=1 Tax=Paenibacillus tianmuensis TaxID=624147 RepID=UPI001C26A756
PRSLLFLVIVNYGALFVICYREISHLLDVKMRVHSLTRFKIYRQAFNSSFCAQENMLGV